MPKQDNRRPKGDTGEAEIFIAEMGTPPVEPDMGSVRGAKPLPLPMPKPVKKAKGGTASSRADGCAMRGKTRGKIV